MQLAVNFKSLVILAFLGLVGYWLYDTLGPGTAGGDISKLLMEHRRSEPARQAIIKRRILSEYNPERDYPTILRALDSPSPTTQTLAIEVLSDRAERRAQPILLKILNDPGRAETVKEAIAATMGHFGVREAIPRLLELTDKSEHQAVRAAAHEALVKITGAGAQVKFADNVREQWTIWLRDR